MKKILSLMIASVLALTLTPMSAAHAEDIPPLPQCASITSLNCEGTFTNIRRADGLFVQVVNGDTSTARTGMTWPLPNATQTAEINTLRRLYDECMVENEAMADTIWQHQEHDVEQDATIRWQVYRIEKMERIIAEKNRIIRKQRAEISRLRARLN